LNTFHRKYATHEEKCFLKRKRPLLLVLKIIIAYYHDNSERDELSEAALVVYLIFAFDVKMNPV
jgi:hypothetical protein